MNSDQRMEVLSGVEKDLFPSLAEADDRQTKRVKNRANLISESRDVLMDQVDDVLEEQGEAMEMSQTLEVGVSFRDKLMSEGGSHKLPQAAVEIDF